MADLFINIQKFQEEMVEKIIGNVRHAGEECMKQTVKNIIDEWFVAGYASDYRSIFWGEITSPQNSVDDFYNSFEFKVEETRIKNGAKLTFYAWSNPDMFSTKVGQVWASRHGFTEGGMNEFIYNLRMYQGVVNFPDHANWWDMHHDYPFTDPVLGWYQSENLNYLQIEPMCSWLPNSTLWSAWSEQVSQSFKY